MGLNWSKSPVKCRPYALSDSFSFKNHALKSPEHQISKDSKKKISKIFKKVQPLLVPIINKYKNDIIQAGKDKIDPIKDKILTDILANLKTLIPNPIFATAAQLLLPKIVDKMIDMVLEKGITAFTEDQGSPLTPMAQIGDNSTNQEIFQEIMKMQQALQTIQTTLRDIVAEQKNMKEMLNTLADMRKVDINVPSIAPAMPNFEAPKPEEKSPPPADPKKLISPFKK